MLQETILWWIWHWLWLWRSILAGRRTLTIAVGLLRLVWRVSSSSSNGLLMHVLMLLMMRRCAIAVAHRWWRRASIARRRWPVRRWQWVAVPSLLRRRKVADRRVPIPRRTLRLPTR